MCHVYICKKKRASLLALPPSPPRRAVRPRVCRAEKFAGKKLFENGKLTDRLFVSQKFILAIPASVNSPNSRSRSASSIERPIESANAEASDASMRASRWAMDGRASRCGTRAAPGPGSGLRASVAHPRAPRAHASAPRLGTVVKRGAERRANWRPCLLVGNFVIAFWRNSRATRRGFLRK